MRVGALHILSAGDLRASGPGCESLELSLPGGGYRKFVTRDGVLVGFASIDWQTPRSPHTSRAVELDLLRSYISLMFGMVATKTVGFPPAFNVASAVSTFVLNAAVEVIAETVFVHASLAPISMVTYWAPCETAVSACPFRADDAAPDTESLYAMRPAFVAFSRVKWDFTVELEPVDQLLAGQLVRALQVIAACVIESPSAAILVIVGAAADAEDAANSEPDTRTAAA